MTSSHRNRKRGKETRRNVRWPQIRRRRAAS